MRRILIGSCAAITIMTGALGAAFAGQYSASTNSGTIIRVDDNHYYDYGNNRHYSRDHRYDRDRPRYWRNGRYYYAPPPAYYYAPPPAYYYAPPPAYYGPPEPSFSFGLTLPIH